MDDHGYELSTSHHVPDGHDDGRAACRRHRRDRPSNHHRHDPWAPAPSSWEEPGIAAISAFTKDYWTDRQKQREHEVALLRIKNRNCQTYTGLRELYNWAKDARAAVATLPPVPELHLDEDSEQGPEKQNA